MRILTPSFCSRLDDLNRRIVFLRNDLRSFKLRQKDTLSFVSYLILSPNCRYAYSAANDLDQRLCDNIL